jgi:hypothetical protein
MPFVLFYIYIQKPTDTSKLPNENAAHRQSYSLSGSFRVVFLFRTPATVRYQKISWFSPALRGNTGTNYIVVEAASLTLLIPKPAQLSKNLSRFYPPAIITINPLRYVKMLSFDFPLGIQ